MLHALRGRAAESLGILKALIGQIEASGVRFRIEVYLSLYLYLGVRCAALLEAGADLRAFAARLAVDAAQRRDWLSPAQLASVPAHVAAAEGRLDDACAIWQRIVDDQAHGDLYGQVVESRLRLADARLRRGAAASDAAAALGPLFDRVAASGEWGPVLFAGPRVLRRLADARWGETLSEDRRATLVRWAERAAAFSSVASPEVDLPGARSRAPGSASAPGGGDAAALTTREAEVLARIAAGDSNKLIARALDVSPHTVKRHVANILDKLALASRGQAAAWYREQRG